jgi:pimeloyl-ACP methyl ester carboxylesterase
MKNGSVTIGNTEMYFVSFGKGQKKIVVLPGLSDGLATVKGKAFLFAPAWKPFFHDFTVYMFSRRNSLPRGYTIRKMAEDQSEAMHVLHLENAAVIGVSQGGMIAQLLAADHPECVSRLLLVVTAPYCSAYIRENLNAWRAMAMENRHGDLMRDTAEKSYSDAYLKTYRKFYPLLGFVAKPKNYERFLANIDAIESFDAREDLPKISCPVLILGGRKDKTVTGEASEELHELLKDSELYMYEEYGHALYEEAKDFNDRILTFLQKPK